MYALFEFDSNSSAEKDVNSTLQIRTWNWRKKRGLFLVSKLEFSFGISSGIKILSLDPIFSSWVNVIKRTQKLNLSRNSKRLKGIYLSL